MITKFSKISREYGRRHFMFFSDWGHHLFFVKKSGELYGCGLNNFGQLSIGRKENIRTKPVQIPNFPPRSSRQIKFISTGFEDTIFLTERAGLFAAGNNNCGQLSVGDLKIRLTATAIILKGNKDKIYRVFGGGYQHNYYLTVRGHVFSAGKNECGQLGLGDKVLRKTGEKIETLSSFFVIHVACGDQWAMFLTNNQEVFSVGRSRDGELGLGDVSQNQSIPVKLEEFSRLGVKVEWVVNILSTAYFLTSKRDVYVCGESSCGQFGEKSTRRVSRKIKKSNNLSGFQLFCTGNSYEFVVHVKDGKLFGNGGNGGNESRMGLEERRNVLTPTEIKIANLDVKEIVEVITSQNNTYLITKSGSVWAAGLGEHGKLMRGSQDSGKGFFEVKNLKLMSIQRNVFHEKERLEFLMESFGPSGFQIMFLGL